jgi:26S proteasome regulatory subunit N13
MPTLVTSPSLHFCQCLPPSLNMLLSNRCSTLNAELTSNSNAAGSSTAAPTDAQTAVNNFLASLRGNNNLAQGEGQGPYTTLSDLLTTSTTIPVINNATEAQLDNFLSYLPPTVLLLAQESSAQIDGMVEPTSGTAQAALEALSVSQKRSILKRVLHSPQFSQGLVSLTMALQQGGLPSVAEALKIKVDNKAIYAQGGEAVRQFVEGIKKAVVEEGQ